MEAQASCCWRIRPSGWRHGAKPAKSRLSPIVGREEIACGNANARSQDLATGWIWGEYPIRIESLAGDDFLLFEDQRVVEELLGSQVRERGQLGSRGNLRQRVAGPA